MSPASKPPTNRPKQPGKPKQRTALTGQRRRSSATTWTWIAVSVVVAVVLVIVLVDTLSSSSKDKNSYGPWSTAVEQEVTGIPASVFNAVGITSNAVPVGGFQRVVKQAPLTYTVGGKKLSGIIYYGAEYCPYCAATRWAIIAALSRFGTFSNVHYMISSSTDVYPNTNTFTFLGSTYTSQYVVFHPYEVEDRNQKTINAQLPKGGDAALIEKYNSGGAFPFIDVGNDVFLASSPYDPTVLKGETWSQIASSLSDPTSYSTQAIVATANYITAGICQRTGDMPASVCDSTGVQAAITALDRPAD